MSTDLEIHAILKQLGIEEVNNGASTGGKWFKTRGPKIDSVSPVDGRIIASVNAATEVDYEAVILKAQEAFKEINSQGKSPLKELLVNNLTDYQGGIEYVLRDPANAQSWVHLSVLHYPVAAEHHDVWVRLLELS